MCKGVCCVKGVVCRGLLHEHLQLLQLHVGLRVRVDLCSCREFQ